MVEIECTTRKVGGSIGVILPNEIVKKESIKPNEKVIIEIKRRHKAKEFFGLLSGWKTPTQKLKDEARKGW